MRLRPKLQPCLLGHFSAHRPLSAWGGLWDVLRLPPFLAHNEPPLMPGLLRCPVRSPPAYGRVLGTIVYQTKMREVFRFSFEHSHILQRTTTSHNRAFRIVARRGWGGCGEQAKKSKSSVRTTSWRRTSLLTTFHFESRASIIAKHEPNSLITFWRRTGFSGTAVLRHPIPNSRPRY